MGRARKTVAKVGASDDGLRAILLRNRERELLPWKLPGETAAECLAADEFWSALDAGRSVVVDAITLWIAFEHSKISNGQFARPELGGKFDNSRRFLVSEDGELSLWSAQDSIDAGLADQDKRCRTESGA